MQFGAGYWVLIFAWTQHRRKRGLKTNQVGMALNPGILQCRMAWGSPNGHSRRGVGI